MIEVDPMGVSAVGKLLVGVAGRKTDPACMPGGRSIAAPRRGWLGSLVLGVAMLVLAPDVSRSGVLSESDFKKVEAIKPLFQNLMGDLVQTSKRSDLSSGDVECVMSTIRELLQISEELSSYEYLITIEKEMTDFGDNSPVKGVVKFAIEKSNTILAEERKRLVQLSDRCVRFPLAFGKTQQALQFIDTTTNLLNSIQVRL
ncbi:MAG: hypothetical protein ACREEK_25215 [Bradyrhizobium sp.]